eukprot:365477-Chlamydomonas_euryale.AAC.3
MEVSGLSDVHSLCHVHYVSLRSERKLLAIGMFSGKLICCADMLWLASDVLSRPKVKQAWPVTDPTTPQCLLCNLHLARSRQPQRRPCSHCRAQRRVGSRGRCCCCRTRSDCQTSTGSVPALMGVDSYVRYKATQSRAHGCAFCAHAWRSGRTHCLSSVPCLCLSLAWPLCLLFPSAPGDR